jgi:hypothetical protein
MKRRLLVVIAVVTTQFVLTATKALATFPWPIIGGGG